jgi:hypothetical protein
LLRRSLGAIVIILKSALKHGVTRKQIDDVLRSHYAEEVDEGLNRDGHYYVMFVGFDSQGILLEIRCKFVHDKFSGEDEPYVFHAAKATKKYQDIFNQRKR